MAARRTRRQPAVRRAAAQCPRLAVMPARELEALVVLRDPAAVVERAAAAAGEAADGAEMNVPSLKAGKS